MTDTGPATTRDRAVLAWAAAVFLSLLASGAPLTAQPAGETPLEAEGGLGVFSLAGDDFPGIGVGPAVEIGLRGWVSPRLSAGAGVHHGWHSASRLSSSFRLLSLHVEPRFHLPHLSVVRVVHPYLGIRAGYARWQAVEGSDGFAAEITARGFQAAGIAGAAVPIEPGLALDVALEGGYVRFGSPEAEVRDGAAGSSLRPEGFATEGVLLGSRVGLRAALPWP